MYLLTTFESSAGDSSSESSAGPCRKRCRSPATTVTSSIYALRALLPSHVDIFHSVEEDINTDVLSDIEADATTVEVATYMDVEAGVDVGIGMEVNVGVDVEDEVEGEVESSDRGTMEIGVDVVVGIDIPNGVEDIKTGHRELEARSLIARGERASLLDQVASLERSNTILRGTLMMESARADRFQRLISFMESELRQIYRFRYYDRMRFRRLETFAVRRLDHDYHSLWYAPEAIEELINQQVAEALAAYETNRAAKLAVESQSQNRDDDDNKNVRGNGNRNDGGNGDGNGGGNGNRNRGGNANGNPNRNDIGAMSVARECTYHDFVKCQLLNFKGTKGVVGLTRWFEKMETIFHISNCPERYQVKYGGGSVVFRGYGGGGDMVVCHGSKGCLDHWILRSSPLLLFSKVVYGLCVC
ncbi:hypothetical protein Tco_0172779 [Tanacetum coccineum]